VLFTYSCSGGISADLFPGCGLGWQRRRRGRLYLERMGGAPDHPMTVAFPD
jgi:23S rRNA (cytosine1962-C5)-methyltransferase